MIRKINSKNAQEIGSSETTREMLLTQLCFEDYTRFGTPMHKPNPKSAFLEWFVGFFEAEGSFLKWLNKNGQDRFGIDVSQKDAQLIKKIRSEFGFGKVVEIVRKNETYWRYYVHSLENIERLIWLFNGNLVTVKKQEQFKAWLDSFNRRHNKTILFSQRKPEASFENAWLSGFFEGDAGFFVSPKNVIRINKNGSRSYDIKMKFSITQKGEEKLLSQMKRLLKIPTDLYQITNGCSLEKYNRIETNRLDCHLLLVKYLTDYRFLGKRYIYFHRWKRILDYRIKDYPITEKSILKLKRLISSIKNVAK